jgi:hypothetical protein
MSPETEAVPRPGGKILIIGGYGQVGMSIAERLAPLFPGRVTVAGRTLDKAAAAAAEIGHGAEGSAVDIFGAEAADALDGIALALVCLDQTDTRFVEQCLSRGIHYVDISADYDFLSQVENLDDLAKRNGATAMLSVGVAPGLTNMLAARAQEKMKSVDRIDILLELGLGDHHGQAAIEWMFDNLDAAYEVKESGRAKSVHSFGESIKLRLPGQRAARPAYRFNFSDQHVIGRTLDVANVSTWVRFEDRVSTWLFAKSSRAGVGRLLRRPWCRKFAVWLFMNVHMGSDICGVAARATGRNTDGTETLTLGLIRRKEALMTAIVAAETARQLLSGRPAPGVFHSEQAIMLDPVVSALRTELPDLVVAL